MFAIIETGGKQYKVNEGDVIFVEKLEVSEGDKITFDRVLVVSDESGIKVGAPVVEGATVTAKVLDAEARGAKGIAFKFKRRKGFHKKKGFRAALTKVEITAINA